ncbi:hypothetical protein GJAV_G00240990 [Gymnothorax javanicus]|nr:hypothetical protein GJAV_G00240990 [Gymnothorax javanicus]
MGSTDAPPHHLLYGTHRGKPEAPVGQEDSPDLSAFLSSEELHKSVNLARQAIDQGPQEVRQDGSLAHIPSPERRRHPQSHSKSPDRHLQPSVAKEYSMKNSRSPAETNSDLQRPVRNTPYGPETQSKKEFLNKAADFIEELSSLFKANSSKRIRPRACKAHRLRSNIKTPSDGAAYNTEDRERSVSFHADELITETGDGGGVTPPIGNQLDMQAESCLDEEESGQEEEEFGQEVDEETELCDDGDVEEHEGEGQRLAAVDQSEEPVPDPPRFIQKLKSREVPEGSKVQLDCIVRGFPIPEVRWFCEGKELENSPDIQILNVGELHSLIIAEAFEEDTGRYSCFASNFYGTDSTSAEIYIEGASSSDSDGEQQFVGVAQAPRKASATFPVSPPSASVENSVSHQPIVCLPVTQYPAPEVPTLPPVQVSTSPPTQVSTALPAQEVSTSLQVVSTPTAEQVSPPLPAPVSPAQESAQVSTAPPAQVTALQPTQEVSPPLSVQVSTSPPAQVSMPILDQVPTPLPVQVSITPPEQVSTQIPIQVTNPRPAEKVSTPLPVHLLTTQRPYLESENGSSYPQGLDGRPIMAAPVFTKSLQDVSASEGQLVVLECRVKGVPSPRVDWYREGTLIDDSPDFRILQKKPRSIAEAAKENHSNNNKSASKGSSEFARHKAPEPIFATITKPSLKPPEKAVSESYIITSQPLGSVFKPRTDAAPAVSSTLPPDPLCPKLQGSGVSDAEPCRHRFLPHEPPLSILKPKLEAFDVASNPPLSSGTLQNHAAPPTSSFAPEPPTSCLKPKLEGVLVNHNEPRSSSRVGLRVHFKLPEDEVHEDSESHEVPQKEPPPVLAKPKLDRVQLQILHNQVLLEQQQESVSQSQPETTSWPNSTYPERQPIPTHLHNSTATPPSRTVHTASTNISSSNNHSMAQSFSYTRPREFVAAHGQSPVSSLSESLSSTESPVPFLNTMAAQLHSQKPIAEVSSPPFSPTANQATPSPPKILPTRVLQSPTSPPVYVSSPPPMPHHLFGSAFSMRPQSPPEASSPTPSGSTPSPIQNPVAFLSSVLPSLPTSPPPQTNAMGLPRGAPATPSHGAGKRSSRGHRSLSNEEIRDSKDNVVQDLERKLRFREDSENEQQKPAYERQSGRQLGPNNAVTTFNYNEEYRVSNFEQRLMSEIEFRLERTPVEESDDEVQHDEIPSGKCIAPIFEKKLKNYRAMEGVPVTFTCKVFGIPVPKVYWFKDGKQILKKNLHYKKSREGDGTCALHILVTNSDDDGNYTVMAANPQGRISCSGHLIVQTGPLRSRLTPMIHSQRVRPRAQEADEGEAIQERFFRPHFLQAPGDMLAHEGRVCRMLVRENGVHSLLIDPLKQSDAGSYTCIATNRAGQSSFCLELTVVEKEVKRVPVFVEKLQNTGIAEGSPVRLECRVLGMPPPVIYWKKDNDSIPLAKERLSMHQDATGYVCLLIQPSKKDDAGWYTVSAKNEAGIVSCAQPGWISMLIGTGRSPSP